MIWYMQIVFRKITIKLTRCEFFMETVVTYWKNNNKYSPDMDARRAPSTAATPKFYPRYHPELGFWVKLVDPEGKWLQGFCDARNMMHMRKLMESKSSFR